MTFLVIHAQKLSVGGVKRSVRVRVCATKRANTIWLCAHRARILQCNPHTHTFDAVLQASTFRQRVRHTQRKNGLN